MATRTVIPFGPQHPVLPEPVHLKLELEDERVVGVTPIIGYIHRGIEKAGEINTFRQNVHITDRICGICSFIHTETYCQGVEAVTDVEVPPRARFLRVFWSELSRTHSHLLWLGLLADALGFAMKDAHGHDDFAPHIGVIDLFAVHHDAFFEHSSLHWWIVSAPPHDDDNH